MELKKATRKQVKLRLNISGPAGSGKTYSALRMAKGICGDWGKIAVIDTENGSASLYSNLGEFYVIDLTAPFTPEKYIQAIDTCVAGGIEVIILDSTTHEWNCILEENELLAISKFRGNTWSAWSVTTPRHDKFLNKVLQCPAHVIACTRSKMETVLVDNGGRKEVKKIGLKDQQREGWEYELTVSLNIDRDTHTATPSKDRTNLFEGKNPFVITEDTGVMIKEWCDSGEAVKPGDVQLMAATTLVELANIYKGMSRDDQAKFVAVKDEMKAKLSPPQSLSELPVVTPPDNLPAATAQEDPAQASKVEESALPEITEKMFSQLVSRLKLGEDDVIMKAKVKYAFNHEMKTLINSIMVAKKSDGVWNGELVVIKEAEFRSLIKMLREQGVLILLNVRKFFSFTPANEEYINKVIVSISKKAA